jgi:hypothetical protein
LCGFAASFIFGTPTIVRLTVIIKIHTQSVPFEAFATLLLFYIGHGMSAVGLIHGEEFVFADTLEKRSVPFTVGIGGRAHARNTFVAKFFACVGFWMRNQKQK